MTDPLLGQSERAGLAVRVPWTFLTYCSGIVIGLLFGGVAVAAVVIKPECVVYALLVGIATLFAGMWAWKRGS